MALSLEFESLFEENPIPEGLESPKCDVVIDDVSFCNSLLEADNFLLSDLIQGTTDRETKSPFENRMSEEITNDIDSDATSETELNSDPFFQGADRDLLEYFDGGSSSDEGVSTTKRKTAARNKENVDSNKTLTVNSSGRVVHNGNGKTIPVRNVTPMTRQNNSTVDVGVVNKHYRTSNIQSVKIVKVIKKYPDLDTSHDTSDLVKVLEEKSRKNAEQAKLNREKKKAYLQGLESDVQRLIAENERLHSEKKTIARRATALEEEVKYLKNVLANESSLSKLLKNIEGVQDVRLSSSFMTKKRSADLDHSYNPEPPSKKRATAGICLHVDKDEVSLEFCSHCSQMAKLDKNK